jgi:hypothetical protein
LAVGIGGADWIGADVINAEGVGEFQPIYEAASVVKRFFKHTLTTTPQRLRCSKAVLLFDMRLLSLTTAVCGPQMIHGQRATINHLCGYLP